VAARSEVWVLAPKRVNVAQSPMTGETQLAPPRVSYTSCQIGTGLVDEDVDSLRSEFGARIDKTRNFLEASTKISLTEREVRGVLESKSGQALS